MALTPEQRNTFYLVNRMVSGDTVLAAAVSEATLALHSSHEGLRSKLYTSLREVLGLGADDNWWESGLLIRDTFDDNVVYQYKGKEYRQKYTINNGNPSFIDGPVIVEMSYVDLASESASRTITEGVAVEVQSYAHAKEDTVPGDAGSGLIRVIAPGQGSSGYYPKEVLKRDGPKVFLKGIQMFWNHATEDMDLNYPAGDLNRQAGVITGNAYWDENGPVGPGLYAAYHAFEDYKPRIAERVKHNAIQISWKGMVGYSEGEVSGKLTRIIQSLNRAESVDFVTLAGAGGAIARASEAATRRMGGSVAQVQVEETELNRLRGIETAATESATRLAAATSALKAARESAATAIIDRLFGTKVIPDNAKETWREVCMSFVSNYIQNETLDAKAFEGKVTTIIAPMPDVKAADPAPAGASEAGRVNLGGGGLAATGMDDAKVHESLVQRYVDRGFKKEVAERMARG